MARLQGDIRAKAMWTFMDAEEGAKSVSGAMLYGICKLIKHIQMNFRHLPDN